MRKSRSLLRRMSLAICFVALVAIATGQPSVAQEKSEAKFPIQAFCIAAPSPNSVARFNRFIENELAPRGINTLVLRVDFHFKFKRRPELIHESALTEADAKSISDVCRKHRIRVIPQVNLLGHQSWHGTAGKFLQVYPEFDETPNVKLPEKYVWPNDDGLYCKSYCTLHPKVHEIVFDCVDEVCDAFSADAFHAGLDEVFYIGHDSCPRCKGKPRHKLFADEVKRIHAHLAKSERQLWMWGDRLLDGSGELGEWEASTNDTWKAIDEIPKDVVICDWHYNKSVETPILFAKKGLTVVTAAWNKPDVAEQQSIDMAKFRESATDDSRKRYAGMMHTVWGGCSDFMNKVDHAAKKAKDSANAKPDTKTDAKTKADSKPSTDTPADCFNRLFPNPNYRTSEKASRR